MGEKKYILILEENLTAQVDLLRRLYYLTKEQADILQDVNARPEDFEANLVAKSKLIDRLSAISMSFDKLLSQAKEEYQAGSGGYEDVISNIHKLQKDLDSRSASLLALEKQNKELAGDKFSQIRGRSKEFRQQNKASNAYHQTMLKLGVIEPQFMDRKK